MNLSLNRPTRTLASSKLTEPPHQTHPSSKSKADESTPPIDKRLLNLIVRLNKEAPQIQSGYFENFTLDLLRNTLRRFDNMGLFLSAFSQETHSRQDSNIGSCVPISFHPSNIDLMLRHLVCEDVFKPSALKIRGLLQTLQTLVTRMTQNPLLRSHLESQIPYSIDVLEQFISTTRALPNATLVSSGITSKILNENGVIPATEAPSAYRDVIEHAATRLQTPARSALDWLLQLGTVLVTLVLALCSGTNPVMLVSAAAASILPQIDISTTVDVHKILMWFTQLNALPRTIKHDAKKFFKELLDAPHPLPRTEQEWIKRLSSLTTGLCPSEVGFHAHLLTQLLDWPRSAIRERIGHPMRPSTEELNALAFRYGPGLLLWPDSRVNNALALLRNSPPSSTKVLANSLSTGVV